MATSCFCKRVLIKAYVSGNLGDDLMIKVLCDRYPHVRFVISGNRYYKRSFSQCRNLKYLSDDSCSRRIIRIIYGAIKRNRVLSYADFLADTRPFTCRIIAGGSMFIDNDDKRVMEANAIWMKKKTYIVGFNFGPYKSNAYVDYYRKLFARCSGITTREQQTKNLFRELNNITVAPDIVFSIVPDNIKTISKEVMISVVADTNVPMCKEQYITLLCRIIDEIRTNNLNPVLVSFCKKEGDEQLIKEILNQMDCPCDYLLYDGSNSAEIMNRFANSFAVVAGRFHSMIIAMIYKKKCFPLIYSHKMRHVLDDIGFHGYCFDLTEDKTNIDSTDISKFLTSADSFIVDENYVLQANKQFQYIDQVLNEKRSV